MINLMRKIWYWYKDLFGIRSWHQYRMSLNKKWDSLFFRKKYTVTELVDFMKGMGLKPGANVLLHSSWNEFYNIEGTPKDFIDAVLEAIGPDGTLAMPCYPLLRKESSVFNLEKTPTAAGLIPEEFRKYPGVKRSISRHSVCALGPMADFITQDHIHSITQWDEHSPYYKMSKINGIGFGMGLGKTFVGTTMHCIDSLLRGKVEYFDQFFTGKKILKYKDDSGEVKIKESLAGAEGFTTYFSERHHRRVLDKHFEKGRIIRRRFSNIRVNSFDIPYMIEKGIEMALKGIVVYQQPNPKKYKFPNQ